MVNRPLQFKDHLLLISSQFTVSLSSIQIHIIGRLVVSSSFDQAAFIWIQILLRSTIILNAAVMVTSMTTMRLNTRSSVTRIASWWLITLATTANKHIFHTAQDPMASGQHALNATNEFNGNGGSGDEKTSTRLRSMSHWDYFGYSLGFFAACS